MLTAILISLIVAFFGVIVAADNSRPADAVGYFTRDGNVTWITPEDKGIVADLRGLSPSDIEKLYPMPPEAEAAIVHADLQVPVIIDGIRYEGSEISLFDGKRLYFVNGKDGTLYAFTSARGLEEYQARQTGQPTPEYNGPESMFFKDIFYTGDKITLLTGYGYANLSSNWMFAGSSSGNDVTLGNDDPWVLARTYVSYSNYIILDCDVVFNTSDFLFQTDGQDPDVQSVMCHEFGHWLMLNDIGDSNSMMNSSYTGGHTLSQDDISGIIYIYGS